MKKILLCNEASFFKTGYSKYGRELMQILYDTGKYELAELACYADPSKPEETEMSKRLPWKMYFNIPNKNTNPAEYEQYHKNIQNVFGSFGFESACLDFKPDIVFSFRDFWMDVFISNSPFRRIFKYAWMPTCDSAPQLVEWLSTFKTADAIFTYTDWSKQLLEKSGITVLDSCPPSCSLDFAPRGKQESKEKLGIASDLPLVGTVMRNQRRKLYDDLFLGFRKYIDNTGNKCMLYCHTSYPDKGWNIPELLLQHGLCNRVLFTYICQNCGNYFASFWQDAISECRYCHQISAMLPNVKRGLTDREMSDIFSSFDVYVQYHSNEGFGIPIIEAASCGTHVMGIDYSAVEDILRKINGTTLPPLALAKELETGAYKAIPDNDYFAKQLEIEFNSDLEEKGNQARLLFEKNYVIEETAEKWMKYFDSVDSANWNVPPRIYNPAPLETAPNGITNSVFVKWLILEVLKEPEKLHSYFESRLVRDLNYGQTSGGNFGLYQNENSLLFSDGSYNKFDRQDAYNEIINIVNKRNFWESKRCQ